MAREGINGMVTLTGEALLDEWIHLYQAEAAAAGRQLELGEGLCWGVAVYLAESDDEAIRRMEPYHDERYKWFEPFGIVRYTDDGGQALGLSRCAVRLAVAARRGGAEGLALRHAAVGDRHHSGDRGALPGSRPAHDPSARGHAAG